MTGEKTAPKTRIVRNNAKRWPGCLAVVFGLILLGVPTPARSQTLKTLYSFQGSPDGYGPQDGVVADANGNLLGITPLGGSANPNCGIAFEIVNSSGTYGETILHNFAGPFGGGTGADGCVNSGGYSPLILDGATGNLYGTTSGGGVYGDGALFELTKSPSGYTYQLLYSFGAGTTSAGLIPTGAVPSGALAVDSAGNVYGTTLAGGTAAGDCGAVYELSPTGASETLLYSFTQCANGTLFTDGLRPLGGIMVDSSGNLYGTTEYGGSTGCGGNGCGAVYELVKSPAGYTESILYSFKGPASGDGEVPEAALTMDAAGNLYGTTVAGGTSTNCGTSGPISGCGTIFELVKSSTSYSEAVLLSLSGQTVDGDSPQTGVEMDSSGDLYTTASTGAIIELVKSSGGYAERVLYNTDNGINGPGGLGALGMDAAGNLYTTARFGGSANLGAVVELNASAGPSASFSVSSLNLGSLPVGTTSSAQSVTVTNSGSANLTFAAGAVTLSGTNQADFAISSDTCSGATVTPSSTCSVGVTFTPSVASGESATLNFADNAPGSPQTVGLSGTGVAAAPTANLSPSSLTFSSQAQGTTSAAQTVTLTNNGNAALSITGVSVTANFAQTNTCGSSVAAGKNCTISVTFTPTATGSLTGTLSITDNAANSPQTINLSGTGAAPPDFTIAVASGTLSSYTVPPGSAPTYTLTLTPLNGFNQTISMACTGAPAYSTCIPSLASVPMDGTNPKNVAVTVTTTAPSAVPVIPPSPDLPRGWLVLILMGVFAVIARIALAQRYAPGSRARLSTKRALATFGGILLAGALLASCGGGGSKSSNSTPGTPAGTYTLTVTGTAGSLSHSTTVTLIVN